MKKGRLSLNEQEFIEKNALTLSLEDMAKRLDRSVKSLDSYIKRRGIRLGSTESHKEFAQERFLRSEHWDSLKERYTPEEQKIVLSHFSEIAAQFNNEVPYTEMMQIIDYLHLEVEIHRGAVEKKNILMEMALIRKKLEKTDPADEPDEYTSQMDILIAKEGSLKELDKSLKDSLKEKQNISKALKATREHRIKRIEDAKQTFASMITHLLENPEAMREVGIELEKHRLATDAKYYNLSEIYEYYDGELDPPILNHETIVNISRDNDIGRKDTSFPAKQSEEVVSEDKTNINEENTGEE